MSGFTRSGDRDEAERESAAIRREQEVQEEKRKREKLAVLKRQLDDVKRRLDLEKRKLAELEQEAKTFQEKEVQLSTVAKTAHAASQDSSAERDYEAKRSTIERKLDEIKRKKDALSTQLRAPARASLKKKTAEPIDDAVIAREQTALDKLRSMHEAIKKHIAELTGELTKAKDEEKRLEREEREAVQEIDDLQERQTQAHSKKEQEAQEAAREEAERKKAKEEIEKHEAEEAKLEAELATLRGKHEEDKEHKRAHAETAQQATADAGRLGTRARENERLLNKSKSDIHTMEQEIAGIEREIQQVR